MSIETSQAKEQCDLGASHALTATSDEYQYPARYLI